MSTTVLVVDDEPIVREVVLRYLERDGFRTLEAGDGDTARRLLESESPGLVILDIMVVVTRNGRFTYTTNTGSNSISGYLIGADGGLTLLNADGVTASTGAVPLDLALTRGSRFLYSLNGGAPEIEGFAVRGDGSLDVLGTIGGLPAGAVGLAAS